MSRTARRQLDGRINLSSNELLSAKVLDVHRAAMRDLTAADLVRYPVMADPADRVAKHLGLSSDEFAMTPGSDSALRLVCQYYARNGGDRLIKQAPNYAAWEQSAAALGLAVDEVAAPGADPVAQGEGLIELAEASTGALIAISVPNGLSGGCVEDAQLDRLADLARERDHLLVLDACYQAFNGPVTAGLARRGGPVVVVQSMSKSHGLAGARVAVLAGEPALIGALGAAPLENAVSATSITALLNAFDHEAEFQSIWDEVRRTRDAAQRTLASWSWAPLRSRANFVTTPLPPGLRSGRVVDLLSAEGYRVKDLDGLPGLADCIRFTVGDADVVDPFLDVLADVAGR